MYFPYSLLLLKISQIFPIRIKKIKLIYLNEVFDPKINNCLSRINLNEFTTCRDPGQKLDAPIQTEMLKLHTSSFPLQPAFKSILEELVAVVCTVHISLYTVIFTPVTSTITWQGKGYLMPPSTLFQLYHGRQFYWWRTPDQWQFTDKLNNIKLYRIIDRY